MKKYIYQFEEGNADLRYLLGGKGANLSEMSNMNLPVPRGFTITTQVCTSFNDNCNSLPTGLQEELQAAIEQLEGKTGKQLNDADNPLLVSVRSGAVVSMPGMMDTILNLGLNDTSVEGLSRLTGNPRFAYDCYRRLLQMFGEVVFEIDKTLFEDRLANMKKINGIISDTALTAENLKKLTEEYKEVYYQTKGMPFPQSPHHQLLLAVQAVFRSWQNPRAIIYREANNIAHSFGTAVTVQEMVFGNSGNRSGTGVVFTRHPATGESTLFGEFLLNAQGEDVVAGIRTPLPIAQLETEMPAVYKQLLKICKNLEAHYKDMQDVEFTIEQEKLYMLQTRSGKRTAKAAFHIAVDLVEEGFITKEDAIMSIDPDCVNQMLHPVFQPQELDRNTPLTKGLPASPGAASGKICFTSDEAVLGGAAGQKMVLVRRETSPDDIEGTIAAQAVVTSNGGMTSHAAVVARGLGKCCVVGCEELDIDEETKTVQLHGQIIREGDIVSVDGSTGNIYLGEIATTPPEEDDAFLTLLSWAKDFGRLKVYANADTKKDIETAISFGADGVGLARTEHMFFEKEKLLQMRILILSNDLQVQEKALANLEVMQTKDFTELYEAMQDKPITIRLLDPPLHEFLPTAPQDIKQIAKELGISEKELANQIQELDEVNPMLGLRGCRIGITSPEIYEMQVKAIVESALSFHKKGVEITPLIMVPLVGASNELSYVRGKLVASIEGLLKQKQEKLTYQIGTMIEIPRACLRADRIARSADFFSFGTNDLTQLSFGFSRDDIGKFMNNYLDKGILYFDPFQSLDVDGVGQLIELAVEKGRSMSPDLPIGVCGELAGDPASIEFFSKINLDYVSCSPYRLFTARLAAAQASIKEKREKEQLKEKRSVS